MPVPSAIAHYLPHRSSFRSSKCSISPSLLKAARAHTNCIFPAEILELIVQEAYNSDHSFAAAISGFASASYAFRQIALRYVYAHVRIGSRKRWTDGMPDVRELSRWVRSLCAASQALAVPEAVNLLSFRLLRTVHITFKTETLANIHRIVTPLLENLPAEITELNLTDLPDVNMKMLHEIAQRFRALRSLEVNCAERLDSTCCWDCFEESSSCIWHSPIPELYANPEEFTIALKNTLRPLSKLEHLHLGIFLSPEDILFEHFTHAHHFCEGGCIHAKPFGPEWCTVCFERYAEDVRLAELQATLMLAQMLKELRSMTWASFFGRQLQEMNGRSTTIWVNRKDRSIRRKESRKKAARKKESPTSARRTAVEWEIPLCVSIAELDTGSDENPDDFEQTIASSIPGFLEAREGYLRSLVEVNHLGQKLRPLTISEARSLIGTLQDPLPANCNPTNRLLLRKLLLDRRRRLLSLPSPSLTYPTTQTLKAPDPPASHPPPHPEVIKELQSIRTTPYERSLAARIAGFGTVRAEDGYLLRDWEARTTWMELMDDVHEHHSILHPEREQARRPAAAIDYQSLRASHLPQVHDLLTRVFWPGIDVTDSLEYSPEKCTVVATYRHLVVGVAILSSPQETYLTYLAVRAGWENAGIATKMLYTLITRNPGRDILLHVSANSPAMLLYNRFGFKAEEFIVGFYEDYLDSQSRGSKNAFRLRLRR
ncbi:hypothetical protein ACEPAH_3615 [Sanghuangporus vaninii]